MLLFYCWSLPLLSPLLSRARAKFHHRNGTKVRQKAVRSFFVCNEKFDPIVTWGVNRTALSHASLLVLHHVMQNCKAYNL
mmetsp:Transcript_3386/g.6648  ORF Transcript_3386/g.6648 Transcript_3386/m.6648 type:complete len:80 (+) Transcript_3386:650-889(+)